MKKPLLLLVSAIVAYSTGCAKPDSVATFKSPFDAVFYTVETFKGHGAADSDFTRVYAHLQRGGKTDKQLVVDGTYLELTKIVWKGPGDVLLCMKAGGITNTFRNEVTLLQGRTLRMFRIT